MLYLGEIKLEIKSTKLYVLVVMKKGGEEEEKKEEKRTEDKSKQYKINITAEWSVRRCVEIESSFLSDHVCFVTHHRARSAAAVHAFASLEVGLGGAGVGSERAKGSNRLHVQIQ